MIDEEFDHAGAESDFMDVDQQVLDEESNSSLHTELHNVMNMIIDEDSNAESDFMDVQRLLDEESNSSHKTEQDVTLDEFMVELERLILKEKRVIPTMSMPKFPNSRVADEKISELGHGIIFNVSAENGAATELRPVVPPADSIGLSYHRKNKQWEAYLWLKAYQLRNNRKKKKGVQVFRGISFLRTRRSKRTTGRRSNWASRGGRHCIP